MRIQVIPGAPAQEFVPPSSGDPLPDGLVAALKSAAKFVGTFHKKMAEGQYVHIMGGKVYASNNRHIVEVDIGPISFESMRLTKSDVTLLARIGGEPATVSVADGLAEFTWPDGQWVRLEVGAASAEFVENCKQRFDHYWDEPEGYSPNPKMLNLLLKKARAGKAVSIAIIGSRAVGMDDGFFLPAQKKATSSSLIRDHKIEPRRDDLFAEALRETKVAQSGNTARIDRLRKRLQTIKDDIAALEAENVVLEEKLVSQHEAIDAYQNGETLDAGQRDLLTPQCHDLVKDESKQALQAEFEEHEGSIPDGWEVTGKRQDDDYIYVTMRRERVTQSQPTETAASKVKKALAQFFKPGFDRNFRIRWDQLGTLAPIVRGGP